jgi:hypothetical protein
MAELSANEVFGRIEWIAHSLESLEGRRMRAEGRIDQFITDLAKANLQPGVADKIMYQLKAKLEGVVSSGAASGNVGPVFRAALGRLTGEHH